MSTSNSEAYSKIILELTPFFKRLYRSDLPTEVEINCGDCYLMALLVYCIGKRKGLNPVICTGGYHCFIMEDDKIYDAYFPQGVRHTELPNNGLIKDEFHSGFRPNEFYKGTPISGVDELSGYFNNCPSRALFGQYILSLYGLDLPMGLRKHLTRSPFKYAKENNLKNAMRSLIKRLRKQYGKIRLHLN